MSPAYVARELLREFPDCFADLSPFTREKRMIGIVNDAMTRGRLDWYLHRGQRRIAPDALDTYIAQERETFEALEEAGRAGAAAAGPVRERHRLPTVEDTRRRGAKRRARLERKVDAGPTLGEIDD